MSRIQNLPPELQSEIVRSLAELIPLYKHDIDLYCLALTRRPELAAMIRFASVKEYGGSPSKIIDSKTPAGEAEFHAGNIEHLLEVIGKRLGYPTRELHRKSNMLESDEQFRMNYLLVGLIHMFSKIETLCVERIPGNSCGIFRNPWFAKESVAAMYYSKLASKPRFFAALKHVEYTQASSIGFDDVAPVLSLPILRCLKISEFALDSIDTFTSFQYRQSAIEELHVSKMSMARRLPLYFFCSLTCLKKLNLSFENSYYMSILHESLSLTKETLEWLELDGPIHLLGNVISLPKLTEFPKLRHIRMHYILLLGPHPYQFNLWEVLPKTLESLELIQDNHENGAEMIAQLIELVLRRDTNFPVLKYISTNIPQVTDQLEECGLSTICENEGVDLRALV
ncbi:hypothetical protein ACMFMF_004334 [Clarireedia jacksonii]